MCKGRITEHSEDGTPLRVCGTRLDTTARRQLEAQLQQALKMEAIGTLAGGIAHDFNNVLGAIIGYGEMIEMFDAPEEGPIRSRIKGILQAAHRAKDLIQQILTFSRRSEQELKPLLLTPIVEETIKFLRASIPSTISIRQDLAGNLDPILGEATQLQQVLMNLGTNAAQAMDESGGTLELRLRKITPDRDTLGQSVGSDEGNYIEVTVSDTGHGMDEKTLARAFDPFFTTKEPGEGTGMGLAVVYGIVESLGGTITVQSELGNGTSFRILLPTLKAGKDETRAADTTPLPTGTERVLFVDDEDLLVDIGEGLLSHLGYEVDTFTSSTEALEAFKAQPGNYDLVITDQTMPHLTGRVMAKEMMAIRPDIPIILCTGHSDQIDADKAKAMGMKAFVMKPIVMAEMAKAIREVLD
jgi:nitrogen-specific signal transduction histidine kinase/CheY-like chemotaxis protein